MEAAKPHSQPEPKWLCKRCHNRSSKKYDYIQCGACALPDFDAFQNLRFVAKGGFGEVWKAWDKRGDRHVAIKFPLRTAENSSEVRRLLREGQALGRIDHRNVVRAHYGGEFHCGEKSSYDGRPYLVMSWVDGENLEIVVKHAVQPLEQAAAYGRQIAAGLAATHLASIVHRDLTSRNIMIKDAKEAIILDYGIAKVRDKSAITGPGGVPHTPEFSTPEQISGEEITERSDIFQLGQLIYLMVCGSSPFGGRAGTIHQLRMDIGNIPSFRRPGRSRDRDLETICFKCLRLNPDDRYQTALEVENELGRYLNHDPINARSYAPAVKLWHKARLHPKKFTAIALAALLAIAFGLWETRRQVLIQSVRVKYAVEMKLAQQEFDARNPAHARELLQKQVPHAGEKDLRGWEWRYLNHRLSAFASTVVGQHSGPVTALAFSKDGGVLASSSADGSVKFWAAADRREIANLHLDHPLTCIIATREERTYLGGTANGLLKRFVIDRDFHLTTEDVAIVPNRAAIHDLDVTADGRFTIVVTSGSVHVKDERIGGWGEISSPEFDSFKRAAASSDGTKLAIAYSRSRLLLWSLTDHKEIRTMKLWHGSSDKDPAAGGDLVFAPQGSLFVSCSPSDCDFEVWDSNSGLVPANICVGAPARRLCFSPDATVLAITTGGSVKLFATTNWIESREFFSEKGEMCSVAFDPNGTTLATGDSSGQVSVWTNLSLRASDAPRVAQVIDTDTSTDTTPPDMRQADVASNALENLSITALARKDSPIGPLISDRQPRNGRPVATFWETKQPNVPHEFRLSTGAPIFIPTEMVFSVSNLVAIGTEAGGVHLFAAGAPPIFLADFVGHTNRIYTLEFSPTGNYLASGSVDGSYYLWDTIIKHKISHIHLGLTSPSPLVFLPSGQSFVAGLRGKALEVWSVTEQRQLTLLHNKGEPVTRMCASPDGRFLAAISLSGEVFLLNSSSGRETSLSSNISARAPFVFTPDSKRLITASSDNSARVWDVETGFEVLKLEPLRGMIVDMLIDGDDVTILAAHSVAKYWLSEKP